MIRARQLGLMTPLLEAVLSKVTRSDAERPATRKIIELAPSAEP